jgi:NAD(P)-dependent dehydrogenase (short-subunit alcohol dehydrogenase family)
MIPVAVLYSLTMKLASCLLGRNSAWSIPLPAPLPLPLPPIRTTATASTTSHRVLPVAIVTGSNTGIGYETARALVVHYGYTVILACRSRDKALAAAATINAELQVRAANSKEATSTTAADSPKAIFVHPLDLSSFDSIRDFCRHVQEQYPIIDVLINNAGRNSSGSSSDRVPIRPNNDSNKSSNDDQTSPCLDLLFQSNFLGHFLLTTILIDTVFQHQSNDVRIVNLSSVMHHFCRVNDGDNGASPLEQVDFWKRIATAPNPKTGTTYAASKLAAILFTLELNRRYGNGGGSNSGKSGGGCRIRSIAVNPGAVYVFGFLLSNVYTGTCLYQLTFTNGDLPFCFGDSNAAVYKNNGSNSDIWRNFPAMIKFLFGLVYLTNKQGCSTSVVAAVSDELPADAIYLQPYWLPNESLSPHQQQPPFPAFEMLGPYQAYRVSTPRLPPDGGVVAAHALWEACTDLARRHE